MEWKGCIDQCGARSGEVWRTRGEVSCDVAKRPMPGFPGAIMGHMVEVFAGFYHVETARDNGEEPAAHFAHATWVVDVEGWRTGTHWDTDLHMERSFKTEKRAREWFDYVTWCVEQLEPEALYALMTTLKGRMT